MSEDMGVSSSLGSAAPGHATASRGSNEDVRQRDALIKYECRRACSKVVLEEFKRTGDPLQLESVQLITPIPGECGLDDIIDDMIKKSYLNIMSWNHLRDEGTEEGPGGQDELTFREVDPLVHDGSFLEATTQKPRVGHK